MCRLVYINNVAQTAVVSSGTFGSQGNLVLGSQVNGTNGLDGTILEVIMTNTAIGGADRANIHGYFLRRWNV